MSNPYDAMMQVIHRHGHSGGGIRLCRFILSLYNTEAYPFSAGNLNYLTPDIRAHAFAALSLYCDQGETDELLAAGQAILKLHPWLLDEANSLREWRLQREREEV